MLRQSKPEVELSDLGKSLSEHEELRLRHLASSFLFDDKKQNPYERAESVVGQAIRKRKPRRGMSRRCRWHTSATPWIGIARRLELSRWGAGLPHLREKKRRLERRLEQNRVVVSLQAAMRGVIARKLVAVWYRKLVIVTIKWQARIRRALCQLHLKRRWIHERRLYVVIHSARAHVSEGSVGCNDDASTRARGTSSVSGGVLARDASPTGRG